MANNKVAITIDIEPIAKVTCLNKKCRFNLRDNGWICCNLKLIEIDEDGKCRNFEQRK